MCCQLVREVLKAEKGALIDGSKCFEITSPCFISSQFDSEPTRKGLRLIIS